MNVIIYCTKTNFEILSRFLLSKFKGQVERIILESSQPFIIIDDEKSSFEYHVLDMKKDDREKIRILPDSKTIGRWLKIMSINCIGTTYKTIHIRTDSYNVLIESTERDIEQSLIENP